MTNIAGALTKCESLAWVKYRLETPFLQGACSIAGPSDMVFDTSTRRIFQSASSGDLALAVRLGNPSMETEGIHASKDSMYNLESSR